MTIPLHPLTRRWLAHLQMVRGRHFLAAGLSVRDALEGQVKVKALDLEELTLGGFYRDDD